MRYIRREEALDVPIVAEGSVCSSGDSGSLDTIWSQLTSHALGDWLTSLPGAALTIPANTLIPGKTYKFKLLVTDSSSATSNSAVIVVVVEAVPTPQLTSAKFNDLMSGMSPHDLCHNLILVMNSNASIMKPPKPSYIRCTTTTNLANCPINPT